MNVRRCVAHAGVLDVDDLALVGLECVAGVEFREAVCAHDLPVGAVVEHPALDARPLERAADDGDDAATAARHLAQAP